MPSAVEQFSSRLAVVTACGVVVEERDDGVGGTSKMSQVKSMSVPELGVYAGTSAEIVTRRGIILRAHSHERLSRDNGKIPYECENCCIASNCKALGRRAVGLQQVCKHATGNHTGWTRGEAKHTPECIKIASTTCQHALQRRAFGSSPMHLKKGAKAARDEKKATSSDSDAGGEDPFDFSALETDINTTIERLKDELSKLRAGGRFNPEVLESLRVQPEKSSNKTVRLDDVAQVIPKGRVVQIVVGEKEHVKPLSSAIQSSSLSLTPQPDPTGANPLLLVINIPPPTAESRKAVVAEAVKAGEKAGTSLRDARGKQQKKLRAMQLGKSARPDDLKKAGAGMEKVVEKGSGEVKRIVDAAKKVLEGGGGG
nr:ribosome-recycling factor [Quercus suber]